MISCCQIPLGLHMVGKLAYEQYILLSFGCEKLSLHLNFETVCLFPDASGYAKGGEARSHFLCRDIRHHAATGI